MKKFFSPLMAILSIVSPICIVGIMCMIETEIIEAVISGLVLGCMVGSVFSIIFWVKCNFQFVELRKSGIFSVNSFNQFTMPFCFVLYCFQGFAENLITRLRR